MKNRAILLIVTLLAVFALSGCESVAERQAKDAFGVDDPAVIADGQVQAFVQKVALKIDKTEVDGKFPQDQPATTLGPGALDKWVSKSHVYLSEGDSYCIAAWDKNGKNYTSPKKSLAWLSESRQLVFADTTSEKWCDPATYPPIPDPNASPSTKPGK